MQQSTIILGIGRVFGLFFEFLFGSVFFSACLLAFYFNVRFYKQGISKEHIFKCLSIYAYVLLVLSMLVNTGIFTNFSDGFVRFFGVGFYLFFLLLMLLVVVSYIIGFKVVFARAVKYSFEILKKQKKEDKCEQVFNSDLSNENDIKDVAHEEKQLQVDEVFQTQQVCVDDVYKPNQTNEIYTNNIQVSTNDDEAVKIHQDSQISKPQDTITTTQDDIRRIINDIDISGSATLNARLDDIDTPSYQRLDDSFVYNVNEDVKHEQITKEQNELYVTKQDFDELAKQKQDLEKELKDIKQKLELVLGGFSHTEQTPKEPIQAGEIYTQQTQPAIQTNEIYTKQKPMVDEIITLNTTQTNEIYTQSPQQTQTTIQTNEIQIKPTQTNEIYTNPTTDYEIKDLVKEQSVKKSLLTNEVAENKALLDSLEKGETAKPKDFVLPSLEFLQKGKNDKHINEDEIDYKIKLLLEKLGNFNIQGDVVRTYSGPVVSTFEFKPAPHIKVSKILNLSDDLAMALSAPTIRIQAPIPGKDVVGIEIPNESISTIYLRDILESEIFKNSKSELTMALGKDIVGDAFVTDLKKLPHLLIAGTTGSGKSVGINSMVLSLLYKNSPKTLRLLMIDPKMLEFSIYNDIPHLLAPVITKSQKAINALKRMVEEMEHRYEMMAQSRTKNIQSYNEKMEREGGEILPYIVIIIDELADLMMTSGKDCEVYIARLAQMARAAGIHLIVATQRPSVDVITGLIKANLPSRLSYRVGQKTDSRVILESSGAESLLGRGDSLFTPPTGGALVRLHAPFASEEEIINIVEFLKSQGSAVYDERFFGDENSELGANLGEQDELLEAAKEVMLNDKVTSISNLQRRLKIGYNRAATIVEQLEACGFLTSPNAKGVRDFA